MELQSKFDSLSQSHAALESSLQTSQNVYQAQSRQLSQTLEKVTDLQSQLAEQAASFRSEVATQSRLIELFERREEETKRRIETVDTEWEALLSRAAATEGQIGRAHV